MAGALLPLPFFCVLFSCCLSALRTQSAAWKECCHTLLQRIDTQLEWKLVGQQILQLLPSDFVSSFADSDTHAYHKVV
jgi:hypothetical protein